PDDAARWTGGGHTSHVALHSAVLGDDLQIGEMVFSVPGTAPPKLPAKARKAKAGPLSPPPEGFALLVSPFPLSIGVASPATASGFFDEENYRSTISGDIELTRLLQVARAFGIGTPGIGLAGGANVELDLSGAWAGFSAPVISGQMQLRNAS